MEIRKAESDAKIESFIETEREKYEAEHGVLCNYTPLCCQSVMNDRIY